MLSEVPSLISSGLLIASSGVLLAAAAHDMVARTVPNWMAAMIAVLGAASQVLHGRAVTGLVAALIVFLAAAFCWGRGWLGGGDVKLLGAVSLVVPPSDVARFIVAVTLTGAVLALGYLGARRVTTAPATPRPARLIARAIRAERWRIRRGGPLPYACAIAAGFLITTL